MLGELHEAAGDCRMGLALGLLLHLGSDLQPGTNGERGQTFSPARSAIATVTASGTGIAAAADGVCSSSSRRLVVPCHR